MLTPADWAPCAACEGGCGGAGMGDCPCPACTQGDTSAGASGGAPICWCHSAPSKAARQGGTSMHSAVKFADAQETILEGLLAPYGGPFSGKGGHAADLAAEFFSPSTDFCLDWFPDRRPLLYHHGLDADTGTKAVGHITEVKATDAGLWMRAQLDKRNEYYAAIRDLVKAGKLGLSSGAMSHLVQVGKSGEILRWPLVEGSATPTPCNLLAYVDLDTAKAHFKSAGLPVEGLKALETMSMADHDHEHYHTKAEGGARMAHSHPHSHPDGNLELHLHAHDGLLPDMGTKAGTRPDGMGEQATDPAMDEDGGVPDTWYLHVHNGRRYGLYRDGTGTVDGNLLKSAMDEVAASDLDEDTKSRVLARAGSIAIEHGMRVAQTVTSGKSGDRVVRTVRHSLSLVGIDGADLPLKATWSTATVNDLPDSAFLYVEAGGKKDGEGKTTPRSLRHFPYKDAEGKVDLPHLRNALARIPQSTLPEDVKSRVAAKARRIAKANGVDAAEASKALLALRAMQDAPDDGDGDGYEGCYEDLIEDLRQLLNPRSPWATGGYTAILQTHDSHVLCCRQNEEGDPEYWRVAYSIGPDGEPVLGEAVQVEQTFVPMKAREAPIGPLTLETRAVRAQASALMQRTQDLHERRTKEGRTFSAANERDLLEAADAIVAAGTKIRSLVSASAARRDEQAKAAYLASPEAIARRYELMAHYVTALAH